MATLDNLREPENDYDIQDGINLILEYFSHPRYKEIHNQDIDKIDHVIKWVAQVMRLYPHDHMLVMCYSDLTRVHIHSFISPSKAGRTLKMALSYLKGSDLNPNPRYKDNSI